ncbi:MAG TPA: FkbM family methyltransferase [Verrucomicrobiae bacterium]|jgi:FkbM family methyltransferase
MALDSNFVRQCVSLGANYEDKSRLAFFALIAALHERFQNPWWRKFTSVTPNLWIKPKQLDGARLLINPVDWSQTVIFEEVFIRNSYDLSKVPFVPQVILDCGAHIGIFSLLAGCKFPKARLIAYEPNPQNVEFIRRQIAGNDLEITLIESAVSIEENVLDFELGNSHSGRLFHGVPGNSACKVPVINFPEAVRALQPASLLLKMDVEGEETRIFPKLMPFLPKQSAIFFETHSGNAGWREIENLLTSDEFKVEQINSRGMFCDGFAYRK